MTDDGERVMKNWGYGNGKLMFGVLGRSFE